MKEENKYLKSIGKDEMYCEWFECEKCEKSNIFAGASYCPDCGYFIGDKMPV